MDEKKKVKILSLGLIRGIIFQVVGSAVGMGFVMLIRVLMGLPAWNAEPVWVGGTFIGVLTFLIGVGAFSDWFKWAKGEETTDHPEADPSQPRWARYYNLSLDHKVIGVQYGVTSLTLLGLAGTFALIFRTELAEAKIQFLDLGAFNSLIGLHGIVMIAAILLGIGAMSNYLVPLMVGASDMAFPRLNAFAFWINVPGALLVVNSLFLGGFDTGWTAYPPLSARAPLGMQMFFLGVYVIGLSSILGSLNIIVTTIRMRTKGMNYFRMPIFVWAAVATSIIGLTATQLIALSFQMVMFQRLFGMGFFDPNNGGNVILFQHLFWFYSHPAVYVFILPGLGMISELLPVFSRKPLFGYKWIAVSSMAIALVGFFVWAHHMFTAGMEEYLRVPFMYSTMLVAVPTGVKFFSWVGTLWRGKIIFPTPMLFTLGAVSVFLLGGLTGPPNATVATDLHLHDTYWIVGHFHATMFGGFIFPFFAALYYWFPRVTGRMYNEKLGKLHFWLMLPAYYVQSLWQMRIGLLGMRRRIGDYDPALGFDNSQMVITVAGYIIFTAVSICIVNFWISAKKGQVAKDNPWNSRSPEWQLPTPIPDHNYVDHPFEVVGEPYDYGLEGSSYVKMLSTQPKAASAD
ncbi:MAG: cytochrome C oxidase subunit I [Anaerolineae bacterium]|jgi:cytochrome c oxidase subunit 1|nr:cytochrome C oxidase subunit I [Anaerolineae bacterium]MBT3714006.1 cytochrome C oxidase subunit I [Anaerolineae bacterium]MBT4311048.1 cytochrome C oxidase subunit I [Anaerolineae bacterium]MBT4459896.1 cytochrome C oxidase subunit I [Anaerolineae bacterium]MBT4841783.1 cytochrome C oxidase subunit I [Anaerolineae bacterium]